MEFILKNNADLLNVQETLYKVAPELKEHPYVCEIKPYVKKRSLDANAYFHVLCDAISKATKRTPMEIKRELNTTYGTPAKDADGQYVGVILPKNVKAEQLLDYPLWIKEKDIDGKKFNCYLVYKPTHELDSKEMAHLIDMTIREAQGLGIETKTPTELAELEGYEKAVEK